MLNTPTNIATKRTAVNLTAISLVIGAVCNLFHWHFTIKAEDLAVLAPVFGTIAAAGYRMSRAVAAKWPNLGYVLFGSVKAPAAYTPTKES